MQYLFKYIGYSNYDLINFVENLLDNPYSDAYKLRQQIDEFHLVKFRQLSEGPVAYTICKTTECAVSRFKDVLVQLSKVGINRPVDTSLLKLQLDTNVKLAEDKILPLLK